MKKFFFNKPKWSILRTTSDSSRTRRAEGVTKKSYNVKVTGASTTHTLKKNVTKS